MPFEAGVVLVLELAEASRPRLRRANIEVEPPSVGSLLVLSDRGRPSRPEIFGGGAPSAPGATPEAGSSVWMKQQRLPYGQDPETQNV